MSSTFVGFLLGFGWLGVFLGLLMDSILWRTNEFKRSTYLCLVDRRGLAPYLAVEFAHSLLVPLCVILYCYGRIFVLALSKKLKVYIGAIAPQEIAQPPAVEGGKERSFQQFRADIVCEFEFQICLIYLQKTFLAKTWCKKIIQFEHIYLFYLFIYLFIYFCCRKRRDE